MIPIDLLLFCLLLAAIIVAAWIDLQEPPSEEERKQTAKPVPEPQPTCKKVRRIIPAYRSAPAIDREYRHKLTKQQA